VLPGRVPFVVPPSAVKSPYYRNPITREIWLQAAESLRQADRVFVVGYSLPPTDLTFAGMLTDALRDLISAGDPSPGRIFFTTSIASAARRNSAIRAAHSPLRFGAASQQAGRHRLDGDTE
jgi:hypothetical protein